MKFLEKDLEDIIYDSLKDSDKVKKLFERGLIVSKPYIVKRQLKIGNYGIADIITLNKLRGVLEITVYELKKDEVDLSTLIQAARYAKGIKEYIKTDVVIKIVLIGKTINKRSDWIYLFDILDMQNVELYEYKYELDGLSFDIIDLDGYALKDNGFKVDNDGW